MSGYTVKMSVGGVFCSRKCCSAQFKDLVVEGSTDQQSLEINGVSVLDQRALYRPDWVALEGRDGQLVKERKAAPQELRERLRTSIWDELELACYSGYYSWHSITVPLR